MTDENAKQEKPHHHTKKHKRNQLLTELSVIFIAIGLVYLIYWLHWGRFLEYTDDAYVNGNIVQLMSQTSGTVIAINTDDTHFVTAGEPLIKLDDTDANIALANAKAALALTARQVKQLYENAEQAKILLSLRQADLIKAQLDLQRRQGLVGDRAVSPEEIQHYVTALKTAQDSFDLAKHNLEAALSLVNNTHLYEHPLVRKAKEALKKAYLDEQRTIIYAPATGYVAKRSVQVGQQISPKSVLLAIIPLNQIWIDANYKESQLNRIRIGQSVSVYADAYSNVMYHGKIIGLSAGTGNVFALLPPQNATGNWIKVVQRVPVRVALIPKEIQAHPLRLGLSMRVTIHTRKQSGKVLSQLIDSQPIYTTHIYQNQLAQADKLINEILQANATDMVFANGSAT